MEVKIKGGQIILTHKLKKTENWKLQKSKKSESFHIFKKPQIVKGYSNSCGDGKGILLIDYDGVKERVVLEDYGHLQDIFCLMQGLLFKTKENNFHVVCLQKFSHYRIYQMLKETRCDYNYLTMPSRNKYRNYVLRIGGKKGSKKPRFIKIIGEPQKYEDEISSAHKKLLKKTFPKIKFPKSYSFEDGLKKIYLQEYETA